MQCSKCGYIVFKTVPKCGNCGFNFKKHASNGAHDLDAENMFTIFAAAGAEAAVATAEAASEQNMAGQESLGGMDPSLFDSSPASEGFAAEFMDEDEGVFELDLSDAVAFESASMMETPYGMGSFAPAADSDEYSLNEIEVEGLGFVPMEDAPAEAVTEIADEAELVDTEAAAEIAESEPETAEITETEIEPHSEAVEEVDETGEIAVKTEEPDTGIELMDDLDSGEIAMDEISLDEDEEVAVDTGDLDDTAVEVEDSAIAVDEIELDTDLTIDEPEETGADMDLQPDLELDEGDLELDPSLELEDLSFDGESEEDLLDNELTAEMDDLGEPDLAIDDLELEDSGDDTETPEDEKQK